MYKDRDGFRGGIIVNTPQVRADRILLHRLPLLAQPDCHPCRSMFIRG